MTNLTWLFCFVLVAMVSALDAETHCPGNAASVPLRLTNGHQMILAVSVNHSGPYNFLLDTGTEVTMVDPALAAELHLTAQSPTHVAGFGFESAASVAQSAVLEVGSHAVVNQEVIVFDFRNAHSVDRPFRGVLGEDFLGQFDMLVDNDHHLLCLDDSSAMAAAVKGRHIALVAPAAAAGGLTAPGRPLIIEARLSGATRPLRLKLDSGTNVSFLLDTTQYLPVQFLRNPQLQGVGLDGLRHTYAAMPLQDLQIGALELSKVAFFTFVQPPQDRSRTSAYDGVLTFGGFRRIFVSSAHQFVVLEPR